MMSDLIPFENIESFIKIVNSEIPGLKLCIHLTSTKVEGEHIVRVVFESTAYINDPNLRNLAKPKRKYFVEIIKSEFMGAVSSQKAICVTMIDYLNRFSVKVSTNPYAEHQEVVHKVNLATVDQAEYDLLRDEYTKAISEFTESSVNSFPWVRMTPRSNNKERSISLEAPSEY